MSTAIAGLTSAQCAPSDGGTTGDGGAGEQTLTCDLLVVSGGSAPATSLLTQAGARTAGYVVLRLPHELNELFREWLDSRRDAANISYARG